MLLRQLLFRAARLEPLPITMTGVRMGERLLRHYQHTLAAYRHAAAIGADGVEVDVRMTRDGVLVCVHDRRIQRTSNGRGVVSALRLDELEQYHFGARRSIRLNRWADDEITAVTDEPDIEDGLVLTLERLLEYATATPERVRRAILAATGAR